MVLKSVRLKTSEILLCKRKLEFIILYYIDSHESSRRRSRSRSPVRHSSRTSIQTREYLVKMRGMPFSVVEDDVRKV